ncbi:hypothetical protein C6499_15720 [Candidatus Poribacteria bacterium]|nr:MAG: hypothetical protein C6499_15720 [Candidatus Poribacteria bacterium]
MARWTGRYVCANYQSTLRANPFCPKAFDETRDNNNSEKKNDDERNFPETDRHTLILAVFLVQFSMENLKITLSTSAG